MRRFSFIFFFLFSFSYEMFLAMQACKGRHSMTIMKNSISQNKVYVQAAKKYLVVKMEVFLNVSSRKTELNLKAFQRN